MTMSVPEMITMIRTMVISVPRLIKNVARPTPIVYRKKSDFAS